jgi:hypothetical protein
MLVINWNRKTVTKNGYHSQRKRQFDSKNLRNNLQQTRTYNKHVPDNKNVPDNALQAQNLNSSSTKALSGSIQNGYIK